VGRTASLIGGAVLLAGMVALPGLGLAGAGYIVAGHLFTYSSILLGIGGSLMARGLQSKRGTAGQGTTTTLAGETAPVPVVYGEAVVGARMVDERDDPDDSGKYLWIVPSFAVGSEDGSGIEEIGQVLIDDRIAITHLGGVDSIGPDFYDGSTPLIDYAAHLGTFSQAVDSLLASTFGDIWPTTSKGVGVAYARMRLTWKEGTFTGPPSQVTARVKGRKVYDPRSSEWAWSNNPALCIRDYLLSQMIGLGLDAADIDDASFIDCANFCDELVSTDIATQARFTCDGALSGSHGDNLAKLLSCCRGRLIYQGGKIRLSIRRPTSPVAFALSEDNIVGGWKFTRVGNRAAPTSARYTWVDPVQRSQAAENVWPRPGDENGMLEADNGWASEQFVDLSLTTERYRAEQISMVTIREPRADAFVELTATEAALVLQVDDVVNLTHSTPAWVAKPFWVNGVAVAPDGLVRLALQEYDATAYSLDPQATFDGVPGTSLPNPFVCAPPSDLVLFTDVSTSVPLQSGEAISVAAATWTASPDPFLHHYELRYQKVGDGNWLTLAPPGKEETRAVVWPVTPEETYNVELVAVNTIGTRSTALTGTVLISKSAAGLPEVLWAPITASAPGKEAIRLIASAGGRNLALFYRSWIAGATVPGWSRVPATGYDPDPLVLNIEFDKPAEGTPNRIFEAYAEDLNGVESEPSLYLEFDGNADPAGAIDVDVDQKTGEITVTPVSIDSDTGSCRFFVSLSGAYEDPNFTARSGEYARTATAFGAAVSAGFLRAGERAFVSGFFFRTTSTDPTVQAASLRSPVARAIASYSMNGRDSETVFFGNANDGTVNLSYDPVTGEVDATIGRTDMGPISFRFAFSTVTYVTDPASATIVNFPGGWSMSVMVGSLTVGQTAYVTVWFSWGADGTGVMSNPIKAAPLTRSGSAQPFSCGVSSLYKSTGRCDLTVTVKGGSGTGGTLEAWVNKESPFTGDFAVTADGVFAYTGGAGGVTITSAEWPLLGDIVMSPSDTPASKIVRVRAVNNATPIEDATGEALVRQAGIIHVDPPDIPVPGEVTGVTTVSVQVPISDPSSPGTVVLDPTARTLDGLDLTETSTVSGQSTMVIAAGSTGNVFLETFEKGIQ
jgi:hypothetical protein